MDNNTVCENINIDECKELFEYEMTEVIIKLKGEFAAVSGCSKRYSEAAVDESSLNIDIRTLPTVELPNITTVWPGTPPVSIRSIVPTDAPDFQTQLDIISSCPQVNVDSTIIRLQQSDLSHNSRDMKTVLSDVDETVLFEAATAACESASALCKSKAPIIKKISMLPPIPDAKRIGGLSIDEPAALKRIDVPHAMSCSNLSLSFAHEISPTNIVFPSCECVNSTNNICVSVDYDAVSRATAMLPTRSAIKIDKPEIIRPAKSKQAVDEISVPDIHSSIAAAKKVNALTSALSASIAEVINRVDDPTNVLKSKPLLCKSRFRTNGFGTLELERKMKVVVPVVPTLKNLH